MSSGFRQTKDQFLSKLFSKYPWLVKRWAKRSEFIEFSDSPFMPLRKKISESRLALITTGGVHLKTDAPFNMDDAAGDPSFREIPVNASPDNVIITHNYYDHSDADKDINIMLPIERVHDLKLSGDIGDVSGRHFSFMGHIMRHHIDTLVNSAAPAVTQALKEDGVDIAILTPA